MNEFKGTPGPWKIISGKLGDDGSEIEAENSAFWAFVSFDTPEAERIPNASLIAAAPELLKALADLLESYESVMHSEFDYPGDLWSAEGRGDVEAIAAHTAIAKALGK